MLPRFISLEGVDGVGKSTQIERLAAHLRASGQQVLCVRDPGSTELGSRLRSILLESDLQMHRRSEAMLFMASRCEMIEATIRPALEQGQTVISDRFLLSNVVYQSVDGGVPASTLWELGNLANDGLSPDLTVLLDMSAAAALKRLDRDTDRMESRGVEYLESVRQGFLAQLPQASERYAVVNADQDPEAVFTDIQRALSAATH